jgi:hypothetical protein
MTNGSPMTSKKTLKQAAIGRLHPVPPDGSGVM